MLLLERWCCSFLAFDFRVVTVFRIRDSTPEDRGRYAVFMMMMFRPWRDLEQTIATWAQHAWQSRECNQVWEALFAEFLRWRHTLIKEATPYYDAALPS